MNVNQFLYRSRLFFFFFVIGKVLKFVQASNFFRGLIFDLYLSSIYSFIEKCKGHKRRSFSSFESEI